MSKASWRTTVHEVFNRRSRRPARRQRDSRVTNHQLERLEERRVMAFDLVSAYAASTTPFFVSGQNTPTLNEAPQELTLRFSPGVVIDPSTLGNISIVRSGAAGDGFGFAGSKNDVALVRGVDMQLSVDDLPNDNQVVIRFPSVLPDDSYRIVIGGGLKTLAQGSAPADSFRSGSTYNLDFRLDVGAFVVSVVPQPITRVGNALSQDRNAIAVYFNREDPLASGSATAVTAYQLFEIDPATGADKPVAAINPTSVAYDATTGKAVLTFAPGAIADDRQYRLQIGDASAAVPAPATKQEGTDFTDDNSSFATAANLGALTTGGATVNAAIDGAGRVVSTPAGDLLYPGQPGAVDEPGHRQIPVDGTQHGAGSVFTSPGSVIPVRYYNFQDNYGSDPSGNILHNAITPEQKQRAREIFEIYSRYTGVRFEETESLGITVATGDVRADGSTIPPTGVAGISSGNAIMNSAIDWGASEYGGYWFTTALHEIGHALGLAHSYDLPSIMGGGLTGEAVFPGDYDTEQLIQNFPTNGSDVDLYTFTVDKSGQLTAETIIARPGQVATSTLDSVITLYREDIVNGQKIRTMVARNDDYYGRDSFVGLDVTAGTYFLAVSSTGNTAFDPRVSDSGYGGRSDGGYELKLAFTPTSTSSTTIVDTSGTPLDGDRDGKVGGACNFWFNTASAANTVYVDKVASAGGNGSLATPYNTIQSAIANVGAKTIIRIVGNTSNQPYLIGSSLQGAALADGKTFNVPKGVTVMIDEGAILKFRAAILDVGTSSGSISSRASAALQVLGTPANNVQFTSYHDDTIGGNSDGVGPAAAGGQWGGIVMRADSDSASKKVFLNSVSEATITYGGGQVLVDSQLESFAPIQLETTRPTLAFNTITQSAGAAIAADPNSFEESDGRVGPEIHGNRLLNNSINGLFVNIRTNFGSSIDKLDVPARFKSTDIVYVLQENLIIDGGVGGYIDRLDRTGSTSASSARVTNLARTSDLKVGMPVSGDGIPGGATIASIDSPTSITLSSQPTATAVGVALSFFDPNGVGFARQSGRLAIDAGVVVKLQGARIELERGTSQLIAEGTAGKPVTFTSLGDNRYGAGGTFSTHANLPDARAAGDWGGIVVNAGAKASIDNAYLGFGGGQTPIEGGFDQFNVIEVHQGDLRVAHSRIENNAAGTSSSNRDGRGTNVAATIFARGAQPVILSNDFRDNLGAIVSINANSLTDVSRPDQGRSTGTIDRDSRYDDNLGPLVRDNTISYSIDAAAGRPAGGALGGMQVRGEEITVESVWDDVDIVYVLQSEIIVQNFHTATGIRLVSAPDASLVVKLSGANAGFTAAGYGLDINDRIGGTVQVVGQPGYPVIFTSLKDDSIGASLDPLGLPTKDTNSDGSASTPSAGDWRSLKFLPLSNDRNVSIVQESEKAQTGGIDRNATPADAQVLGVLAPNFATGTNTWESAQEKSGDANRRLGFEVHGHVAIDSSTDVDVYSFLGYAGSEVWIDLDKTSTSLDAMLELLDANGNVLARSADTQTDSTLSGATVGAALDMSKDVWNGGDFYSTNPRDAGMRVVLPLAGQPSGTQAQYYVRVRSQPHYDSTITQPQYEADLADPAKLASGATSGAYELRIRLRQQDEKPGSTVRYADIRYPTIGIDVQGLPRNSLLTGENGENATDANNTFGSAQYVGNLLQTDHNTISIAGNIASQTDVDWYTFALNYEQIQVIGGLSSGLKSWATMIDLDYGDGFRGDLSLWVFDSTGKLIFAGRDSNVASDQPGAGQGSDADNLAAGSFGKLDPMIGTAQLPAGNPTGSAGGESGGTATPPDPTKQLRYYVAVSSNEQLPSQLNATFKNAASNTLVRMEPIDSTTRVVEDHIGYTGYLTGTADSNATVAPTAPALIDTTNRTTLDQNIRAFTLADVSLFLSGGNGLRTYDATTGAVETTIVNNGFTGNTIGDIDMRPDGRLYAYAGISADTANVGKLMELDSGNGSIVSSTTDAIANKAATGATNYQTSSDTVTAMTFKRTGVGTYDEVWFIVNEGGQSKLYRGATGGTAAGGASATANQGYADKEHGYRGRVTVGPGDRPTVTGLQFVQDSVGQLYGVTADGRLLTISPHGKNAADDTADYDAAATVVGDLAAQLTTFGATGFVGLAAAPQNLEDGLYRGKFFALTNTGDLVLLDPADPTNLQTVVEWAGADHLRLTGAAGATGLAFSPLDINLWHPTAERGNDAGHGVNEAPDNTRAAASIPSGETIDGQDRKAKEATGGASLHFGLENYTPSPTQSNTYYAVNGFATAGQYGVMAAGAYDWQQELTANAVIANSYNLPGGAYGSTITNSFDLTGYQNTDKPTLYFNYWLQTEANTAGSKTGGMVDSARAFISSDGGVTWTVVATNDTTRSATDKSDAELPTFTSVSSNLSTNSNQNVQQLFNSSSWRQARIDLGAYAGLPNLRLRFDFSTAGEMDATQQDLAGNLINKINGPAGTFGDFDKPTRGQNNGYEGFYVDDLIVGFAERGEMVTGAVAGQTDFFSAGTPAASPTVPAQSLQGNYQLEIRRGTEYAGQINPIKSDYGIYQTFDTNDDLVVSNGALSNAALGDANQPRQQGQFLIEGNSVSNALTYGISIDAGLRDAGTNAPNQGVTASLPVLNTARLVPGVVVTNNIIASSGTAGILFSGDANTGNVPLAAVPYGQIVNNTLYGGTDVSLTAATTKTSTSVTVASTSTLKAGMLVSGTGIAANTVIQSVLDATHVTLSAAATATAGSVALRFRDSTTKGTGVSVTDNAGPTLLNNLFANLGTGVAVDASSIATTVIGTSAYWNAASQVTGGSQSQQVTLAADPFVNAPAGNFYLNAGSQAIDSSLNTLADRSSYVAVASAIGIPQSPIIAPDRDRFGQLRGDDPTQASLPGLGSNAFKDRGAVDRVDTTQPSLALLNPLDNGPDDKDTLNSDAVRLELTAARSVTQFELQLNDIGVGIDSATVSKAAFTLTRDGVVLVEGTDYLFRYFENNNRVVFESAAVFPMGEYVLTATTRGSVPGVPGLLTDLANNVLLPNKVDGSTSFTISLADVPSVPANLVAHATDATVDISWAASLANNSPLVRYEVEYRTFAGVSWTSIDAGLATSKTVTGLSNGTAYVFRVRAVNGVGNGDYSAESAPAMPLPLPTLALAADTGSSGSDGITNNPSVTVAGLFAGATWESSINGGNTWTAGVGGTFTLPAGTYAAGTVEVRQLLNGFASSAVSNTIQWVIDQTAPVAPVLALGAGVATGASAAEGTQVSGVVTVSGETGGSIAVTFTRGVNSVTKTVTGTGAAQAVVLAAGDLTTLGDGTINVSGVATDVAGNVGPAGTTSFTLDTVAPTAPSLALGTGVANGATAAEATQNSGVVTVSGELSASIAVTFTRGANSVTKTVTGTGSAQAVVLLAGDLITLGNGTINVSAIATDAVGNAGPAGTTSFTLDTVAPNAPVLVLGTGVAAGATAAEATQLTGVVTVAGESGASIAVTFTRGANSVTKTVTGTGAAQAVVLLAGDLTTLGNGTINVSAIATDLAGNVGSAGTTSFTLDTVAPTAPSLALGTGVANGATAAEATQVSGVVTVSGELGASIAVTFTRGANSVIKTVTGTGAAQAVVLAAGDLTTLGNGTINVSGVATDVAGNAGPAGTTSFTLDTVAPVAPSLALGTGVTNGATAAEATQNSGVVTVSGESGASIAVTFTRGTNSVTKTVTGTGAAQAVVLAAGDLTTLGNGTINVSAIATDVAGNAGPAGMTSFTLDTVAPVAPTLALGTGVANGATAAEATQLTGVVTVSGESGASIAVTFTRGANSVTKTVTGTGSAQAVVLLAGDLTTLGNGTINVSGVATDVAGNTGTAGTTSFILDTVAPSAPSLELGVGVANGATAAEATQVSGVVTVSGEANASITVTFTGNSGSVTKTVTGNGSAQAVVLAAGDLTTLGDGTVNVSAIATDVAGNAGPAGATSFTLDTVAPTTPSLALGDGVAAGATATEATQNSGVVTVSGEASASIAVTFTGTAGSVTKTVTGTGAAQAVVLAAGDLVALGNGTVSISAIATDVAGNAGPAGTMSFTLDTVAPTAPSLALGTGVANGATATEATQNSGVVTVSGESGGSIAVTFTGTAGSVTKTVTGTGAAQAVTLLAGDLTTLGNGTISVSAVATDVAGNAGSAGTTSFALDTVAPTIASFSSSAVDGTYVTANSIPLVATLSEPVQAGGSIAVTLNTNAVVILTAAAQGNILTGTYVVSPGETTSDLNVVSYTIVSAINDLAGNLLTSTALPAAPGQLATVKEIAINAAITATANGFSTDAAHIADKKIAVRVIPITFSTAVRGVSLANFRLFYNGRSVALTGAKLTGSGANYTLTLPVRATNLKGIYTLKILPNARIIATANGAVMTQTPQIFWGYGRSVGMTPTPRALAFARK